MRVETENYIYEICPTDVQAYDPKTGRGSWATNINGVSELLEYRLNDDGEVRGQIKVVRAAALLDNAAIALLVDECLDADRAEQEWDQRDLTWLD